MGSLRNPHSHTPPSQLFSSAPPIPALLGWRFLSGSDCLGRAGPVAVFSTVWQRSETTVRTRFQNYLVGRCNTLIYIVPRTNTSHMNILHAKPPLRMPLERPPAASHSP